MVSIKFVPNKPKILFQLFDWNSHNDQPWFYTQLMNILPKLAQTGVTHVWFPPCCSSASDEGYLPNQWRDLNTRYGSKEELIAVLKICKQLGIIALFDGVFNHRVGWKNWGDFKLPHLGTWAVCGDDEWAEATGAPDTGMQYHAGRDLDHTNPEVQAAIIEYCLWLKNEIGFDGVRGDMVHGYGAQYFKQYIEAMNAAFAVGEIWPDFDKNDPDANRQAICDWLDGCGGVSSAFDFTTKFLLQEAVKGEYWRLKDKKGKPAGLIGWWPEKAVTFVDNHDTGRSRGKNNGQRHAVFPFEHIMKGYAYILTHPGVPCVYYYDFYHRGIEKEITELISLRQTMQIDEASEVNIHVANETHYVAKIDDKVLIEIGQPLHEAEDSWVIKCSGYGYQVWIKKALDVQAKQKTMVTPPAADPYDGYGMHNRILL